MNPMNRNPLALAIAVLAIGLAPCATRAQTSSTESVVGWWAAQASHGGEQAEIVLHLAEDGGKRTSLLTLPALGFWEMPFGAFEVKDNQVMLPDLHMTLTYDPAQQVLRGTLSEDFVPVFKVDAEFHRIEPRAKPALPQWNHPKPQVLWQYQADGPVWAGLERDPDTGQVIVATDAGSVTALDSNGRRAWSIATGGKVRAQPTIVDAHVYVSSDDGFLYKLDKRNGLTAWRTQIVNGGKPRLEFGEKEFRWDRYGSAVVTDGKRIYVGSRDGNLYALAADDGHELWRASAADMITGTPAVHAGQVIYNSYDKHVYAVDADDGKLRWKRDLQGELPSDVVIANQVALIGSRAYELNAVDLDDGAVRWNRYVWFSWIESPPNVRDDIAYFGTSDALKLFACEVESGRKVWERPLPGWSWSRPAVNDQHVYAAVVGAKAYAAPRDGAFVAVNRATGTIEWLHPVTPVEGAKQWGFGASPALSDSAVYAADLTGRVFAFAAGESGS
jgi:outer membrane protein assembly factor BamB